MRAGVVLQGAAQVHLGFRPAAAEEPRHLEVPASDRAVGGPLLEGRIDLQDGFQLAFDLSAITQPHAEAVRLGQRAHVGGEPEVPLRPVRARPDGGAGRLEPLFERRAPLL
ncbi:MAG TPA: hypothetical protein VK886_15260 [Vicinamibacterales bacterium]|nr:hypothetical protein [Vicinamibacterales bacterium]